MNYEPGIGTLIGLAMGQADSNNDERYRVLAKLNTALATSERKALQDRSFTVATAAVVDEVLEEIGRVQRKELPLNQRSISLPGETGRHLRNEAYVRHANVALTKLSEGRLKFTSAERDRIMSIKPLI